MNAAPISITPARFNSDLAALNALGRDPDSGVLDRPAGGTAWHAAREWFERRLAAIATELRIDENDVAAPADGGRSPAIVIAGELAAAAGAGPFDGSLALCAGLEVLRCLPRADGVALAAGPELPAGAAIEFRCQAVMGPMLADSARTVGVALSHDGVLDMRRACEIGEASGVGVLPMPFSVTGAPVNAATPQACVLLVDAVPNTWPLDAAALAAAGDTATLLLNLVRAAAAR